MKSRGNTKPLGSRKAALTPLLCTSAVAVPASAFYAKCGWSVLAFSYSPMFLSLVGEDGRWVESSEFCVTRENNILLFTSSQLNLEMV